jgi:hypothetical protein
MFIELKLSLLRRHCLLTNYIYEVYDPRVDTLTIDVALDCGTKDLPLEFLICRRKDLK